MITSFSFLPADYDAMQTFLEKKLEEGLRLKWVKWGFAGFTPLEEDLDYFIYAVDPYLNQNALSLGKMPRIRSNLYMQNKWTFVGKSGGNHIFYSATEEGECVPIDKDAKQKVGKACMTRNGALLVIIALLVYYLANSKTFIHNFILSSTWQGIALVAAFLGIMSIASIFANAAAMSGYGGDNMAAVKRRGMIPMIRRFGLLAMLLVFFGVALSGKPEAIPFAAIPLGIVLIAGIIVALIAKKHPDNLQKRITPVMLIAGGLMVVAIVYSVAGMNTNTAKFNVIRREESIAKAASMPVLRYEDFFDGEYNSNCEEKKTVLGESYRFQEFNDTADQIVFSNCNTLGSEFAVNKIFDYLYSQAEADYEGSFEITEKGEDYIIYKMIDHPAYLIRNDGTNRVILLNVTGTVDEDLLLQKIKSFI